MKLLKNISNSFPAIQDQKIRENDVFDSLNGMAHMYTDNIICSNNINLEPDNKDDLQKVGRLLNANN